MAYEGSVELISGIKTKNNGTFPLVDAPDVRINDSTRLSDFVQSIGDRTGAPNGFATLDQNGKVPSIQLPSYVDDVLEYDNQASFPSTGETGKIYVAKDTNKMYRWSGSGYVVISETLALGETSSTAYRGDRGKIAYDHASAKGAAFSSGLYKITTNAEGHVTGATAVQKSDITGFNLDKSDVGLGNVDNTSDADKPVSTAVQTEIDKKADLEYVNALFSGSNTNDLLQLKYIPGTIQSISYDTNDHVNQIAHKTQNENQVVRMDAFSFNANNITEIRTLNTGESLTIIFDFQNMTTTATYASA